MNILIWLGFSLVGAALYRLGGWEKGNRLFRILGIPLTSLLALWLLDGFKSSLWWAYLLTFGLTAGAVSAYWQLDEKRWGYWAHGLGLSLAALPIAFATGNWLGFGVRTIVLTGLIVLVSEKFSNDILEEGSRGFVIVATTPLLFV